MDSHVSLVISSSVAEISPTGTSDPSIGFLIWSPRNVSSKRAATSVRASSRETRGPSGHGLPGVGPPVRAAAPGARRAEARSALAPPAFGLAHAHRKRNKRTRACCPAAGAGALTTSPLRAARLDAFMDGFLRTCHARTCLKALEQGRRPGLTRGRSAPLGTHHARRAPCTHC